MNIHRALTFLLSLLLFACASTRLTSVRDPSSLTAPSYRHILVLAPFSDLEQRTQAEGSFVDRLETLGLDAAPSMGIFLPTRSYSDEDFVKALHDARIDGILLVSLTDAFMSQTYVPGTSTTTGTVTLNGNLLNYSSTTIGVGGHQISKPRLRFELRLIRVSDGSIAWLATSLTKGNEFARFGSLVQSLARASVDDLKKNGLIDRPPNPRLKSAAAGPG
jgi:hypothetical protein